MDTGTANGIRAFLNDLSKDDLGKLKLINMYFSIEQDLIDIAIFTEILQSCYALYSKLRTENRSALGARDVLDKVSNGGCDNDETAKSYLRVCKDNRAHELKENEYLNTVMSYETFLVLIKARSRNKVMRYIRNILKSRAILPINIDCITKNDFKDKTERKPGNVYAHAWVSSNRFHSHNDGDPICRTLADWVVDERGINHHPAGTPLIRFNFSASCIKTKHTLARPIFSDGGGWPFRVCHLKRSTGDEWPRAHEFSEDGYGTTMHLGKFRRLSCFGGDSEFTGLGERIMYPYPCVADMKDGDFFVEYLGETFNSEAKDPPAAFVWEMLSGKDHNDMIELIVRKIS